jgi:sugar (pentulose or hexulose) kinase
MNLLLGIDLGTTGIRTTLLSETGDVFLRNSRSYPAHSSWTQTAGRIAEEDPAVFSLALKHSISEVLDLAHVKPRDIAGIGISAMAPDAVAIDADGTPLCRCILWMDRRAVAEAELIRQRIGEERIIQLSGNPIDPYFGLTKVLWIKHNLPDIYRRAAKIVSLKDLLVGKLTGSWVTDVSHAGIAGIAFDIRKNCWNQDVLRELGLESAKLPEALAADRIVGGITSAAAEELGLIEGTPVANGMIDSAAGYLACGTIEALESAMTLGTSSCWGLTAAEANFPRGMNITKTPWHPDLYLINASLAAGGAMLSWLHRLLGLSASDRSLGALEEEAARVPIGSERLLTLPHFLGERAPLWDPHARGVLLGLSPGHNREHLYRSALEGIALSLYRNKMLLEEAGIAVRKKVIVSGGSARSRLLRCILADTLDLTIEYIGDDRGGDYAAAWLAGKAVGIFPDFRGLRDKRRIVAADQPDRENHLLYKELYDEVYKDLYPRLKEAYMRLAAYPKETG